MEWDNMMYMPVFMKIGYDIQVMLRLLIPQQPEGLQFWYYKLEGFMMYAVEMTSNDMTSSFMMISLGIWVKLQVHYLNNLRGCSVV